MTERAAFRTGGKLRTALRRGVLGAALLSCAHFLGNALATVAVAEQKAPQTAHAVPPGTGHLLGWDSLDPEKARIFDKPTDADPRAEVTCLALNIYFEARSEPVEGKLAVGHVVMNRVASDRFPATVCDVVRQGGEVRRHRCQFSWWCDGQSDRPRNRAEWRRSMQLALEIYWGMSKDPTDGALWYHADYVDPNWRTSLVEGPKIGRHIFYSEPAKAGALKATQVAARPAGD